MAGDMSTVNDFGGVKNCYVFKSRLQEYAQKVGISTPVYETLKEGPSHEPVFKSTVIVNNVRYDSLPGFFNRKAAEQSAAEVALMEIHKSGHMKECIPTVHETGLCKNLLQEYAQKMNYAIPSYICNKQPAGKFPYFCTIQIGGIQYIGAAAKTKKEAEIKAARTALLAIQCGPEPNTNGASQFTVVPGKKKGKESEMQTEALKHIKTKKVDFKKKWSKRRFPRNKGDKVKFNKTEPEIFDGEDAYRVAVKDIEVLEVSKDLQAEQLEGSNLCVNEQGSGNKNYELDNQVDDLKMLPMVMSRCFHDALPEEPNLIFSGKGSSEGLNDVMFESLGEF